MQTFYKEFITWKALDHPNLLPLLGVVVEDRFALVSEWMENGNINRFVASHHCANRFELVGPPSELTLSSHTADNYVDLTVGRRRKGLGLYARPENGPWRSQGGTFLKYIVATFQLTLPTR